MAYRLPPGVLPSLFRQKRKDGKGRVREVGCYYVQVKSKRINLRTANEAKAEVRRLEAINGVRDWPYDEVEVPMTDVTPPSTPTLRLLPAVQDPQVDELARAVAGLGSPQTGPQTGPEPEDPPHFEDAEKIHEGDGSNPPPPSNAPTPGPEAPKEDSTTLPDNFLDQSIGMCAMVAVELQVMMQAYLIKRFGKVEAGPVPDAIKVASVEVWTLYFKTIVPKDVPLPGYLVAPILLATAGVAAQVMGAQPINKVA